MRCGQLGNPGERCVPAGRTQTVPGPGAPGRSQQSARTADRRELRGLGARDPPNYRRGGRAAVYFGKRLHAATGSGVWADREGGEGVWELSGARDGEVWINLGWEKICKMECLLGE